MTISRRKALAGGVTASAALAGVACTAETPAKTPDTVSDLGGPRNECARFRN